MSEFLKNVTRSRVLWHSQVCVGVSSEAIFVPGPHRFPEYPAL